MKGSSGNDWMVRKHMDSAETCWIRVVSLWFDAAGWKVRKHMDSTETCWIRVVSLWFPAALRREPLSLNSQPAPDRPGCSDTRAWSLQELQGSFPPSRIRKSSESRTLIQNVCIWTICFLPLSHWLPQGWRFLYGGLWRESHRPEVCFSSWNLLPSLRPHSLCCGGCSIPAAASRWKAQQIWPDR